MAFVDTVAFSNPDSQEAAPLTLGDHPLVPSCSCPSLLNLVMLREGAGKGWPAFLLAANNTRQMQLKG